MSRDVDVLSLLNDPDFMFAWAETPLLVAEEVEAVEAYLRRHLQTVPLTQPKARYNIIGTRQLRHHDVPRLRGTAIYTHDVCPEGTLYAAILYSPYPHAKIKSINTERAEALPGVRAVVTHENVYDTGVPKTPIYRTPDRFILQDEVFYVGDEVAAVAADDLQTARDALKLIEVDYEVLPAHFGNPEDALKDSAPRAFLGGPRGNLGAEPRTIRVGDVDAGFAQASVILEGRYEVPTLQHAPLEPKSVVMSWDDDQLTAWVSAQGAHTARTTLSRVLGLPISKVQVICHFMGGGFGDKSSNSVDRFAYIAAILSKLTHRPVKLEYSRPEEFTSSVHKAANVIRLRAGVKQDGTLTALHVVTMSDQGAWNGSTGSPQSSQESQQTLYMYGTARFEQYALVTNRFRTGPMRDVNESSGVFALEIHMDRLAEALQMDPVEFRLKNVTGEKSPLDGQPWTSNGVRECIQKGAEAFGWKSKWHPPATRINGRKAHGVGMGVFASQKGSGGTPMSGIVKIELDGSVSVVTGAQEIGGGQLTEMMMIAAEELGASLDRCQAYGGDTAGTSDTGVTAGSRMTKSGGTGIRLAAVDARQQLYRLAISPRPGNQPPLIPAQDIEEIASENGFVFLKADPSQRASFKQVMSLSPNVIIGRASALPPAGWGQRTFGATFTELEVDLDTGEVTVLNYTAAHDVGKVINQLGVEQQFDGGLLFGFGFCLSEGLRLDPVHGFPLNSNWENYAMLTVLDVPQRAQAVWVESIDNFGPFGAKGMGEPACTGPVASIPNAIYNAVGVRFYEAPITRAKLLAAIQEKGLRPA